MQPEFKKYQIQVKKNAKQLAEHLTSKGYKLVSGGTDNHLLLIDLRPQVISTILISLLKHIDGARVDVLLDKCGITVNKNTVPGDTKPMIPGGLRLGN